MWYTSRNSPLSHLQFHIYTFDACQAPWTPLLLQVMQSSSASPENWRREAKPNLRRSWAISHFNIFCKIQRPARDFFLTSHLSREKAVLMLVSHSDFSASSTYLKEPVPIPPDSSVGPPKKRKVKALNTGDQEAKHQRCDDTTAKAG